MKSNLTMAILGGVLLAAGAITPAIAAVHKPAKMTCEEFVMLHESVRPKVVYWAEGFNNKGRLDDAVVDVDTTDKLVPILVDECQKAPKATLWQKIKKHL